MKKILIFFMIFLLCISCSKMESSNNKSSEELKENEIWNPVIILTREETKLVKATSNKLYKNTNEMALLVGNVVVDFYNDEGDHISILYSDSARIDE